MAVHELATNAAKYGSLSVDIGRVDVRWTVFGGILSLTWRETGGPKATPPKRVGFGTRIITGLGNRRKGRTEFDWQPSGLIFTLEMPFEDQIAEDVAALQKRDDAVPRLLLVEDELVVGMFMHEVLETNGYRPTDPIGRLSDALAAAKAEHFRGAVLDMNLHGEIVYPLAELLTAQGVPFLFVTGYAAHSVDPRFASVPMLQKPVLEEQLAAMLQKLLCGNTVVDGLPSLALG
jgi:CheY-like chemotaxis protein